MSGLLVEINSKSDKQTEARQALFEKYHSKISQNPHLSRTLVSFQANKDIPFYSWFKYKEGFSQRLVSYLLNQLWTKAPGVLLDPFAGAGTALFAANEQGWKTKGIEVLPVGIYAIKARLVTSQIDIAKLEKAIKQVSQINFEDYYDKHYNFKHIAITAGAFPEKEERQLAGYIAYCSQKFEDENVKTLLLFAAFCILEEVSYTRKDGQYLRWDYRSGRSQGQKPFDKGVILPVQYAIPKKLSQMLNDLKNTGLQTQLQLFEERKLNFSPDLPLELIENSCLKQLPLLAANSIDFVFTSPPYANRYDYTRTYALELVFLQKTHENVKQLRQEMLSCTVENKEKREQLQTFYRTLGRFQDFELIDRTFCEQKALQEVLAILDYYRTTDKLNNKHIVRLVKNYFYEMCFVIFEISRVLSPNGVVAMVNDNVQYAGEEIPVDLILSDIAETFGLSTKVIWTLGRGKGNSSQQMGNHGRSELRKCVYVWEKL